MSVVLVLLGMLLTVHGNLRENERPVITLDLDEATLTNAQLCLYQEEWSALTGGNLNSAKFPGAPSHCDSNLLAKTCALFSNSESCPEPTATAYDHHEGELLEADGTSSVSKVYLLNVQSLPGTFPPMKVEQTRQEIDYEVRGEYFIEYGVSDSSGNNAETVHYVMLIDDTEKPSFADQADVASLEVTYQSNFPSTLMSNVYALPGLDNKVLDSYDGDVTVTRNIQATGNSNGDVFDSMTADEPGEYDFTYSYNDYASVFGVDHKNNVVTFDARVTIVDTLSPQIFCSAGGAAVTCGVASDRKGFNCKDATIACPTQHLECDDLSNYLELAKAEDFGAVAVDISDDVSCTGTACSVVRTTDVTPTYEFDKELGVITVTYSATDNAENKGTSSRQITIWDNSPPLITVYNSGKFYYNSMAYNQLYCGYDSAEYFLELWSRGFKVGKSCVYDTVVEGKGLEAGDYKEPVVDGAVSDDELPANCHVTYRYHAVPDGSDDQWMPADDKCGASDYGGVVISFEEMVQLFKQWCVTLASGDRLCNKFTQSGGDNHAGQEKYNYQTFSMEYTCTSVSGYTASACRIVENQDNENLICHPPTPSPTPAPTTSPTSGYVILVDLTTVNTTSADEIRTGMIDACSLLSADDVLHVGTTPHDLTDLLEDVGEDRRLLEASTFKVNRDVGYAKYSYKVLSTREELILLYEQLKNWFEMMGCSEYDSEGADKAGFCLVYYEISDPITPPDDPPLPTPQPTAYPTTAPTPHPCDDGSHGCDEEDNGGICHMAPGLTNGWTCACDVGYECVSNCDAPYSGHTCDATPAPTAFPTAMPTNFPTTSPTSHPTVCSHFHLDDEGDNFDISCEISDGQGGTKWSDDHRFCAIPETQDDGSCGFRCSCDETHGTDLCYTLGTNFENKWNQSACWLPRPPALVIDGGGIIHEDATHDETKKFNDPGATCTDDLLHCKHPSDCDLPVRISGDQVDLTVVGTYWVHYHCSSPAGFNATLPRQVVVEDKTCPKCAYEKKNAKDKSDPASITVEASFPYMPGDYRPTCEDECGFSADPKCAKHSVPASIISNDVDVEKTGKYHVEFNAADHHGNRCHESRVILTVTVVDTMRPIIGLQIHPNEPPHSPSTGGVSSATFKTHKGEENPARTHFQFMANAGTSSGRSSSLAAAAVAVIGVALLAVAARTIGPPIAVPV